jgi:putative membrane protein
MAMFHAKTKGHGLMKRAMISPRENRSFLGYVILAVKGFCMGASDVVPGVSGGTMALILGIYEDLIDAIKSFDLPSVRLLLRGEIKAFLNHVSYRFLLAVGAGIFLAVFSLAKALSWLLQHQPVLLWSFFFGLILASIIVVGHRVKHWCPSRWTSLVGGALGAYFIVGLVPVSTPEAPWFLFLSGAIAICAMILPGISGSFILVLLGKYEFALQAVNHRDVLSLSILAIGAATGIVLFSRLLGWLLDKWHDLTVSLLAGLMLGSLRKIWPWKETLETMRDRHGDLVPLIQKNILPPQWGSEVVAAISLMVLGFLMVNVVHRLGGRHS